MVLTQLIWIIALLYINKMHFCYRRSFILPIVFTVCYIWLIAVCLILWPLKLNFWSIKAFAILSSKLLMATVIYVCWNVDAALILTESVPIDSSLWVLFLLCLTLNPTIFMCFGWQKKSEPFIQNSTMCSNGPFISCSVS